MCAVWGNRSRTGCQVNSAGWQKAVRLFCMFYGAPPLLRYLCGGRLRTGHPDCISLNHFKLGHYPAAARVAPVLRRTLYCPAAWWVALPGHSSPRWASSWRGHFGVQGDCAGTPRQSRTDSRRGCLGNLLAPRSRRHITIKTAPAVEAGITDHEWTLTELLAELATLD